MMGRTLSIKKNIFVTLADKLIFLPLLIAFQINNEARKLTVSALYPLLDSIAF